MIVTDKSEALRISFVDSVWLECELLSVTATHYFFKLKDEEQQQTGQCENQVLYVFLARVSTHQAVAWPDVWHISSCAGQGSVFLQKSGWARRCRQLSDPPQLGWGQYSAIASSSILEKSRVLLLRQNSPCCQPLAQGVRYPSIAPHTYDLSMSVFEYAVSAPTQIWVDINYSQSPSTLVSCGYPS